MNETNKMNPAVKDLWLKALRSGEYKQGRQQLRNEKNGFCCLGVLCNLHAQAHPFVAQMEEDPESYLGNGSSLPHAVALWAGLDSNDDTDLIRIDMPFTMRGARKFVDSVTTKERKTYKAGRELTLAMLNDDGFNFRQIADVIEAAL